MIANPQTCCLSDNFQLKRSKQFDLVDILKINDNISKNNDTKQQFLRTNK